MSSVVRHPCRVACCLCHLALVLVSRMALFVVGGLVISWIRVSVVAFALEISRNHTEPTRNHYNVYPRLKLTTDH